MKNSIDKRNKSENIENKNENNFLEYTKKELNNLQNNVKNNLHIQKEKVKELLYKLNNIKHKSDGEIIMKARDSLNDLKSHIDFDIQQQKKYYKRNIPKIKQGTFSPQYIVEQISENPDSISGRLESNQKVEDFITKVSEEKNIFGRIIHYLSI